MTTQNHAVGVEDDRTVLARVVVRRAGGREASHAAQARRHVLALGLRQQGEAEAELLQFAEGASEYSRLACQIPMEAAMEGLVLHVPAQQY